MIVAMFGVTSRIQGTDLEARVDDLLMDGGTAYLMYYDEGGDPLAFVSRRYPTNGSLIAR